MPIEAVIFDMDGVLLDSEPLHLDAINSVLAREGHHLSEAENERYLGTTVEGTWEDLFARYRLPRPLPYYLDIYDAEVLRRLGERLEPAPGVIDLLGQLERRKLRLGLASSSRGSWIKAALTSLGIDRFFEAVVPGESVARGKPEPDIFLRAAELLAVTPARCLVVEDSPRGITAGKRAGMTVLAVMTPYTAHLQLDGADYVLRSLDEFDAEVLGR